MTESTDLAREVRFRTGYDHRDDLTDRRGAHGFTIEFIVRGELGAITASVNTGWMARPLVGNFFPGRVQARREAPGVDASVADIFPMGGPVVSHTRKPHPDLAGPSACDVLGGECFGDAGYLMGDAFLKHLVSDGEDAAWQYLEDTYAAWFTPAVAVSQ